MVTKLIGRRQHGNHKFISWLNNKKTWQCHASIKLDTNFKNLENTKMNKFILRTQIRFTVKKPKRLNVSPANSNASGNGSIGPSAV